MSTTAYSIKRLDEALRPDAEAQLALSYRWLNFLRSVYGFEFQVLQAAGTGLCLPFAVVRDIYGPRLVAVPFTDYLEPGVSGEILAAAVAHLIHAYPGHAITLRLNGSYATLEQAGFGVIRSAHCHRLKFTGPAEALWQATEHSFRKNVNKALRGGVTVAPMNDERGLDAFYAMLTRLRRTKFHALPHARRHYAELLAQFVAAGAGNLWVASLGTHPIAAAFVLHADGWLVDKMGVSDGAHLDLCPNNLLLWEVIKHGVAGRFTGLDMGLTPSENAGLKRFKETLGCVATPITFYRFTPPGYDHEREKALRQMLSELTSVLVRDDVPDVATQAGAEALYRYFC